MEPSLYPNVAKVEDAALVKQASPFTRAGSLNGANKGQINEQTHPCRCDALSASMDNS